MTDLHCHILHNMDDGPASLEASLALCRIAMSHHIERVAATPHIVDTRETDAFLEKRAERLNELQSTASALGIQVGLYPGAEVLVSDSMSGTEKLCQLTLNRSRYLLVEFPRTGMTQNTMYRCVTDIKNRGLVPILAHPERYAAFQRDGTLLNLLMNSGVLFQIDAASLRPSGNKAEYRLAREMLRRHMVSFIATDAHSADARPNTLLDYLQSLSSVIPFDELDALVSRNPDAVLQDIALDTSGRQPFQVSRRF